MKGKHEEIQIVCDNQEIYNVVYDIVSGILENATDIKYLKAYTDTGYPQHNVTFKYFLADNKSIWKEAIDGR